MFRHTVTYKDFNGKPHTEELYFHMMVPELADLEFNPMFETSLSDFIREGMGSGEGRKIHTVFKLLVANSYGQRSADGSEFVKSAVMTEKFFNSPKWEQFFLWLTDNPSENGQAFFNGIFPEAMQKQMLENFSKRQEAGGEEAPKKLTELSRDELVEMLQKRAAGTEVTAS